MTFPTFDDLLGLAEGALPETLVEQSGQFYDLLTNNDFADESIVEIRIPQMFGSDLRVVSGYAGSREAFQKMVAPFQKDPNNPGAKAVYATLNPVKRALWPLAPDKLVRLNKGDTVTSDKNIHQRCLLFIDADSVKESARLNATTEELKFPLRVTAEIPIYLRDNFGWGNPVYMGLSGNGGCLLYRINLPNDDESTAIVTGVLEHLASVFNSETVKLDTLVFNASRIVKIPGTVAAKGPHSDACPWRYAQGFFFDSDEGSAS